MKKIFFTCLVFFFSIFPAVSQNTGTIKKAMVFSAIKGSTSKPDSILLPSGTYTPVLTGDAASFKILSQKKNKLVLAFNPSPDFTGITKAHLQIKNTGGRIIADVNMTGLSTKGLEGENEAPLSAVIEAAGYKIKTGWSSLAHHNRPELQGDEIPYSLFKKANAGKVEMIPLARYSPDFELPFGYYVDTKVPEKHKVGVLAKAGTFPEHQILFPAIASGSTSFDPGQKAFGFFATSPTHTAYSEDVWNMLYYPSYSVRATRIYPVSDHAGKLIANNYLVCFEEAKNGDYNDYVFLVKNIAPQTKDLFTSLFNGRNLDGWHTFLNGIGANADPNKNFIVQDGSLYVNGKDLGYAITNKGYRNYHFKLDYKWGDKKWPPRENAKKDAGICYNIPLNEPDSIWPQSIECQIQEGDVGDFWLLGFSTIKVNGVQNKPANHTRMIKQNDGEKPGQEWNTVEVISYNGKCIHIVNGIVVNAGDEASTREGRILLQSEYSEIYYKNIKIRNL